MIHVRARYLNILDKNGDAWQKKSDSNKLYNAEENCVYFELKEKVRGTSLPWSFLQ